MLLATLAIDGLARRSRRDVELARTLAVIGLTAGNLMPVALNLSAGPGFRALFKRDALALWGVSGAATAVQDVRGLLHLQRQEPAELGAWVRARLR